MEWRVSPVQGKTLCKVTVGAGGKAVFPEKKTINNQSHLCTLHHIFCFFHNEMRDMGSWRVTVYGKIVPLHFCNSKMILTLRKEIMKFT